MPGGRRRFCRARFDLAPPPPHPRSSGPRSIRMGRIARCAQRFAPIACLPAWQALRLAAFRPTMWVMMWVSRENNNKRQQYQRRFADVRSVRATFNNHQNQSCEDRDG